MGINVGDGPSPIAFPEDPNELPSSPSPIAFPDDGPSPIAFPEEEEVISKNDAPVAPQAPPAAKVTRTQIFEKLGKPTVTVTVKTGFFQALTDLFRGKTREQRLFDKLQSNVDRVVELTNEIAELDAQGANGRVGLLGEQRAKLSAKLNEAEQALSGAVNKIHLHNLTGNYQAVLSELKELKKQFSEFSTLSELQGLNKKIQLKETQLRGLGQENQVAGAVSVVMELGEAAQKVIGKIKQKVEDVGGLTRLKPEDVIRLLDTIEGGKPDNHPSVIQVAIQPLAEIATTYPASTKLPDGRSVRAVAEDLLLKAAQNNNRQAREYVNDKLKDINISLENNEKLSKNIEDRLLEAAMSKDTKKFEKLEDARDLIKARTSELNKQKAALEQVLAPKPQAPPRAASPPSAQPSPSPQASPPPLSQPVSASSIDEEAVFNTALKRFDQTKVKLAPLKYKGKMTSSLTRKDLKKVIATAAKNIGQDVTHQVGTTRFVAKIESSGHLFLTQIGKELGQGSFGTAFVTLDLMKGTEEVYKQAKQGAKAAADVQNEVDVLQAIHTNGTVYGVQQQPTRIVHIQEGPNPEVGFLGKKYDGDFLNKTFKDMPTTYSALHQLLSGLNYLSTNDYIHGDLKPENILIREDTGIAHIADMGGVRNLKHEGVNPFKVGTSTPSFIADSDLEALAKLAKQPRTPEVIQQAEKLRKSMDVLAMGLILYESLANAIGSSPTSPCRYYPDDTADVSNYNPLKSSDPTIQALDGLIKKMLNPDPLKRIAIAEAQKQYEAIMQKQPLALDLIEKNKRAHKVVAGA